MKSGKRQPIVDFSTPFLTPVLPHPTVESHRETGDLSPPRGDKLVKNFLDKSRGPETIDENILQGGQQSCHPFL